MLGRVGPGQLELTEVHRFANEPVLLPDGLHWDILRLYHEVLDGLRQVTRAAPDLASVGVDSWAVDYGLLDEAGRLLGNPHHYRDGRTVGAPTIVHGLIPQPRLYERTGLQFLPFNTIYQLAAARGTVSLASAQSLLLIPDLIGYWLSGRRAAELTNASTTGLLDVHDRGWANDIVETLGLSPTLLADLRTPGDVLGPLRRDVLDATRLPSTALLTLVGSHDTASAVVGVPADGRRFAYIACGTWSLVGVELDRPQLSEASRLANFTNELGVDGRIRYLRNVMGLWLLQESLVTWQRAGSPAELGALLAAAGELPPGGPTIDPDDPAFLAPGNMPARIEEACLRSDQRVPSSRVELVRCIVDSLAGAYARTVRDAVRLSGSEVDVVHIVGGGVRNALLCQLTADACQLPVIAGPVEATAIGNVLVQARAHGFIEGDLDVLRALVRTTHDLRRYEPSTSPVRREV